MWRFLTEQSAENCEGVWQSARPEQMVGKGAGMGRLNQSSSGTEGQGECDLTVDNQVER